MTTKPSSGASVHLRDIHKTYDRVEVLKGIDLEVPAGSFTTLLGPSGSGKTTSLAITSGLVQPSAGSVLINGVDCTGAPANKRNLGFVFQSYALFPHMTIERNIMFPLTLRKTPKAEARRLANEALDLVRLDGLGQRYPAQLSGGQQQRVALARAVVFKPQVLLMDEPLGALDAGLRTHLQREIVRIGRELGVTIIYVTHDQDEALSMSTQIALFSNGVIEQVGSPTEIYNCPRSEFVANFVGSATLVAGRLAVAGDDAVLQTPGGHRIPVDAANLRTVGLRDGDSASAVLRPECITETSASDAGAPIGTGTITDLVYTGREVRVEVALEGWPSVEYHCETIDSHGWRLGDEITLACRRGRPAASVPSASSSNQASRPALESVPAADPLMASA